MHAYRDQYAQVFNNGQDVVLIAASADPLDALASWARDDDFQFLMASDADTEVAARYGAVLRPGEMTNRNLFVIGPDGRIAYTATPFQPLAANAYDELGAVIDSLVAIGAEAE